MYNIPINNIYYGTRQMINTGLGTWAEIRTILSPYDCDDYEIDILRVSGIGCPFYQLVMDNEHRKAIYCKAGESFRILGVPMFMN